MNHLEATYLPQAGHAPLSLRSAGGLGWLKTGPSNSSRARSGNRAAV